MSRSNESFVGGCLVIGFVGLIGLLLIIPSAPRFLTYRSHIPCDLNRVENVRLGDKSEYVIFCEQESFKLRDDGITLNWRSSDIYGRLAGLPLGTRVYLDGYGIRLGITSTKRTVFRVHFDNPSN